MELPQFQSDILISTPKMSFTISYVTNAIAMDGTTWKIAADETTLFQAKACVFSDKELVHECIYLYFYEQVYQNQNGRRGHTKHREPEACEATHAESNPNMLFFFVQIKLSFWMFKPQVDWWNYERVSLGQVQNNGPTQKPTTNAIE